MLPSYQLRAFARGAPFSGLSAFADRAPEAGDFFIKIVSAHVFPTQQHARRRHLLASRTQPRYNIAGIDSRRDVASE